MDIMAKGQCSMRVIVGVILLFSPLVSFFFLVVLKVNGNLKASWASVWVSGYPCCPPPLPDQEWEFLKLLGNGLVHRSLADSAVGAERLLSSGLFSRGLATILSVSAPCPPHFV